MSKKSALCVNCGGTGRKLVSDSGSETKDCPRCTGTGLQNGGEVHDSDMMDKLDDILDKCKDIFEKLN